VFVARPSLAGDWLWRGPDFLVGVSYTLRAGLVLVPGRF
jgi:hypothetical protein